MRVNSTQWPTSKIVNSFNNHLDTITGYAIGADRRFQWDDTNHTKLPIGTIDLVANQADYSFLTDEQGNRILTVIRIDIQDSTGVYRQLQQIDEKQMSGALDNYQLTAGLPVYYDLIADNVVRLYPKPSASVTAGIKFYFQRSPSYFIANDTTKEPGVASTLHRGFVIKAAYEGAITLGLQNIQALSVEDQKEEQKMKEYFMIRNVDSNKQITAYHRSSR